MNCETENEAAINYKENTTGIIFNKTTDWMIPRIPHFFIRLFLASLFFVLFKSAKFMGEDYPDILLWASVILIVLGFYPVRFVIGIFKRLRFVVLLKKIEGNGVSINQNNIFRFVSGLFRSGGLVIEYPNKLVYIKWFIGNKNLSYHWSCDVIREFIVHRNGAHFVDRRVGQFNIMKTPDLSYSDIKEWKFELPDIQDYLPEKRSIEKYLLFDSGIKEFSYSIGSNNQIATIGDCINGYKMQTYKSLLSLMDTNDGT